MINHGAKQFVKFSFVGGFTALIDLVIYNVLVLKFKMNMYLARTISFTIAICVGYFLHRFWTFRSKDPKIFHQFFRFVLTVTIGLAINLIMMKIVSYFVLNLSSVFWQKNIPVLVAMAIAFLWNFFVNKYWAFKHKEEAI